MSGLEGRVALVTGAAKEKGIGRAIALRLARDGADVVVADFCKTQSDDDPIWNGLNQRAEEIRGIGRKSMALNVNITDEKMVEAAMNAIRENFERLDILCNNAGTAAGLNLSYMLSPAEWRNNIEVNLNGTFIMSRAAAQWMVKQKRGGCIVNTSSWRGFAPSQFLAAYCAAKAGVISLTQVMALELAPHNVRVNAICPGKVDTDMERMAWDMKAAVSGKKLEQIIEEEKKKIPLGRLAMPDDVAGLVSFMVSDEGSYITGQAIPYTGGMILVHP